MSILITLGILPFALAGLTALCACIGGCCCADRRALMMDAPATAELTFSVPSVKVS
jgi:hypothetical protein